MDRRFFCDSPIDGEQVVLRGSEGRHLARVLRAQVGDRVVLFDGSGWEFSACIAAVRRDEVTLQIESRAAVDRELSFPLHIAVALPKGDRQKWLVEKAVELGVHSLIPLITHRGVAQPVPDALQRLQRHVIEACKQCRRNRLLQLATPLRATELGPLMPGATRLVAHPGSNDAVPLWQLPKPDAAAGTLWAIGPEGGFDEQELKALRDGGFQPVDLGPRILRIETAVCVAAAATVAAQ